MTQLEGSSSSDTRPINGVPGDEAGPSAGAVSRIVKARDIAVRGQPDANRSRSSMSRFVNAHELSPSSLAIHADDYLNPTTPTDVAPPLHVSTTFRFAEDADKLKPHHTLTAEQQEEVGHVYSRDSAPNTTRLETILASLLGGPCLTYASGLAAFHAMLVFLNPRRIAIGAGYHGCHGVISLMSKLTGLEKLELESSADADKLQPGDIIHVETPLNPTGEARDLSYYGAIAREKRCYLTVDATFGPPPLQAPFAHGVDVILHSGTKYFGGHSDMLCGVLAIRPDHTEWPRKMLAERLYLGSVMGSLEGWLGVRSLRTLAVRVERQASNTAQLVGWLAIGLKEKDSAVSRVVADVKHASLQPEASDPSSWLCKQMPNGYGPVFSIIMKHEDDARRLPSKLALFHHATSLGGVESLIEWRAMSDSSVATTLLRVSIGIEGWEDLKADLERGFEDCWREGQSDAADVTSTIDEAVVDGPVLAS